MRSQRGAALVLVLLIIALLMTLVLEFDRSVRLEHRAAGNYRDATAAFYLAKAGVAEGRALLMVQQLSGSTSDNLTQAWALPGETPLGPGMMRVSIIDEERFFPINSLVSGNVVNVERVAQFQRLLRALQIDDRLADAVIDWIDQNDVALPDGAESDYYALLPTPYRAHNAPIDSLEELRMIKGVTDDVYTRLAPHLTAQQSGDSLRVNLNTADPLVLGALDQDLTPDLANRLIDSRPIQSLNDIGSILGNGPLASRLLSVASVTSNFFTIQAEGVVNGVSKTVIIQTTRNAQSPLWVRVPS
ncbi:MAG TPA: type II secretion system minor pseudopilin GspK [Nitrospiria bacterium]|nr:type II secretion system minor pseudopilin GspK [Nitrospiria bacterium]